MPIQSVEMNGTKYVPLAEAVRGFQGNVNWDNQTKQATVASNGRTAVVTMADENVQVDGQTITLSAPPLVKDDTLYVPQDFFQNVRGQPVSVV